ncbi:hypothetical protein STEG23_036366, partial [Scotinomys teguina]
MAVADGTPEDSGGGSPGVWGSWGPWSACSRSCSGGVMEQTRPCLPSSYRGRGGSRPSGPTLPFAGHVVSAVRTSVPLHRSREEQHALVGSDASRPGPTMVRGSRHPQSRGREPSERRLSNSLHQEASRHLVLGTKGVKKKATAHFLGESGPYTVVAEDGSRTRGPIGPGKYGYGKAPYILPLQTDTTHTPQRLRRQRPSSRHSRSEGASAARQGYSPPAHQFSHNGPLYQSDSGPRSGLPPASEASVYQLPLTHDQSYPAASGLFHSPEMSSNSGARPHGAAQAFSQHLRSTAISCIGAYRQYKLCNTNACPESGRSIREVQCASYNNKPFMGRFYEWEPFAEAWPYDNSDFLRSLYM